MKINSLMDRLALLGSCVRIRSHRVDGKIARDEPMLLAIEQGNTNSLFAIHDGEHWIAQWRIGDRAQPDGR